MHDGNDNANVVTLREFLRAIEQGAGPEEITQFLHPEVHQTEFPNLLFPKGAERDLATMQQAGESGKRVVSNQRYDVPHVVASGDRVSVEIVWTATLNVPVGTLTAGSQMRAYIGQFFAFRDGKIISIRNYDCYEPW
jgi:ketosteroid isomerase-like protein